MRYSLTLTFAAALILSACSAGQDGNEAGGGEVLSIDNNAAMPATSAPPASDNVQAPDDGNGAGDGDDDGDGLAIVPARFHGEWNSERSACGTGLSETRLRISGDRLRFYESVGDVRRVEVESERVIEVTAEYRGEGETWQDERRLSLSADGDSLTVDAGPVRYRCG